MTGSAETAHYLAAMAAKIKRELGATQAIAAAAGEIVDATENWPVMRAALSMLPQRCA